MSLDAVPLHEDPLAAEGADFIVNPEEVAKGAEALAAYLESLKTGEARRMGEEALDLLAVLFTEGQCDGGSFPWHQVKPYHSAAAFQLLKEPGTPARLESLRFERDPARKYGQVPTQYATKQLQKMRTALRRVLRECEKLGYVDEDEAEGRSRDRRPSRGRILSDGEYRALTSACATSGDAAGSRDALILSLGYQGGLQSSEIRALNLKDLRWDTRRNKVTVYVKGRGGKRGRTVPLQNGALIALEDWLEARDRDEGPLLCPVRKGGRVEVKRLGSGDLRELCRVRASTAGVEEFALNDLMRSAVPTRNGGRARRARSAGDPAVLYAVADEESETEQVHFPYRTRKQELL